MQACSPANRLLLVRLSPEPGDQRANQQLLRQAHARVRRHFEARAVPAGPAVPWSCPGEYSLSMQNSARCVLPVTSTSRLRKMRSTSQGGQFIRSALEQAESDLQFVDRIGARLVHARSLAGGSDEHARKQVRQRRMIQPVPDHALQQIRTPQERTIGGVRAAQHDVIAAAGAGMAAVEHELFRAQPRLARLFVERRGVLDQFPPIGRRMDVHFDDAGVGRDLDVSAMRESWGGG